MLKAHKEANFKFIFSQHKVHSPYDFASARRSKSTLFLIDQHFPFQHRNDRFSKCSLHEKLSFVNLTNQKFARFILREFKNHNCIN